MINNILPSLARLLDPHVWLSLCEYLNVEQDKKTLIAKKTRLGGKQSMNLII